jgi:hypothetical protein
MTEERVVVTHDEHPVHADREVVSRTTRAPSGGEILRRTIVFIFAVIQALIFLRIVLLMMGANEGNGLVDFIYAASSIFVAPFEGLLNSDAIAADGSVLDIAAVAALIGWTVLELVLLALVGIFRREPA